MGTNKIFDNNEDTISSIIKNVSINLFPQKPDDEIDRKREELLDEIGCNIGILKDWPIEKLEILDKYYDESISKLEKKVKNRK